VNIPLARTRISRRFVRKRWPPGSENIYDEIVGLRHPRGHSEFLSANVQKRCIAKSFNIYHNKKLITQVGTKKVSMDRSLKHAHYKGFS